MSLINKLMAKSGAGGTAKTEQIRLQAIRCARRCRWALGVVNS